MVEFYDMRLLAEAFNLIQAQAVPNDDENSKISLLSPKILERK
jgi:hypothetical protein